MRTLKRDMVGEDVRYLQYEILKIQADGSFGSATEMAVKKKQEEVGFRGKDIDGSVGPLTQKAFGMADYRIDFFPKSEYDIWFAGTPYTIGVKPVKTLKTWAKEEKADYVYNLAMFIMDDKGIKTDQYGIRKGRTLQDIRGKGKDFGYGGRTTERIVIDNNNFCAGWSLAIKDGKIYTKVDKSLTARNANGFLKDGTYFHAQSVTISTEYAFVKWVNDNYDVALMLMQDGGGSTGKYDVNKDVLLAPKKEGANGRPVATVVCMKKKAKITDPVPAVSIEQLLNHPLVKHKIIPKTAIGRRPQLALKPEYITIHGTGENIATAKDHANNVNNNNPTLQTSWHIVVDEKEAYQVIPLNEVAWHAGDGYYGSGNRKSIGIEICESGDRRKALDNAISIVKALMKELNLDISNIRQHYDWSRKDCPRILRNPANIKDGLDWGWFIKQLSSNYSSHWAQPYLDSLVRKGVIIDPNSHKDLDATITKGQLFAIIDKIVK